MSNPLPPVAVLIRHRVADYEVWKKAFDKHQSVRQAASALGHEVLRGADDPNIVYVYGPATNVDKIKAFMDSAELRGIMKDAGVQGPPTITLMTPTSDDSVNDTSLASMVVRHPVKDYKKWRAAYDDFDDYRREHGIVGHAVNQVLGNPNQVIVYHQAKDHNTLRTFLASQELKETMERAGVTAPPDVEFVQSLDLAEY